MFISKKILTFDKPPPDEQYASGQKPIPRRGGALTRRSIFLPLLLVQMTLLQVASAVCTDPTTLTAPTAPSTYTYTIGGGPYSWTVPAYTQGVDCAYTETLTMTPSASWISIVSATRVIKVTSTDTSLHNTSTTFTVVSTINDNSGNTITNNQYSFTITLNNPCKSATLNTPSLSTINVDDGATATGTFTDLADSYYTEYGNPSFCGTRTFTIEDSGGSVVSWLTVAFTSGSTYTITASPLSSNTELQTTHTMTLRVVSDTYSSDISAITVNFSVVVATPACNCA